MKFCKRPFEQIYVSDSYIKTCPWTNLELGNPLEESIDKLWHNDKAEEIRESIRDGSFRFCRKEECPWCASDQLEEVPEEVGKNYRAEETPTNMNVSYDRFCNHSCPSCRSQIFRPDEEYVERMKQMKATVLPIANRTQRLSTCGMGDCFSSPFIMEFLQELRPERPDFYLSFETNGVLADEKHWEAIRHLHKYPINFTVTPNSFERYTYRYLSGGHDTLELCKKNLKFISTLRKEGKVDSFKINMVVQESNYCQIPDFIQYCLDEYDPDIIQIKPLNRWFCLNAEGYWFKNILNPLHPYHENYLAVMNHPILQHPKVFDWTTVSHDRAEKKHPAAYDEKIVGLLYGLLQKENCGRYITERLEQLQCRKAAIYGAWKYGELTHALLTKSPECSVVFFIDKYKGGGQNLLCCDLPIRKVWGENFNEVDAIFISVLSLYEEVSKNLRDGGFQGKILSLLDLINQGDAG